MFKNLLFISLFGVSAFADMMSFYQTAVKNLQYDKRYILDAKANKIAQSAIIYSKYTNFSVDIDYVKTYVAHLPKVSGNFDTTDIILHDTLDLFGKNDYKIHTLDLENKGKKSKLDRKKEQLFIALANMIALYNQTNAQLNIQKEFYDKEYKIYKKLEVLSQNGDVTELDILRLKNTLSALHINIVSMQQKLLTMKAQLHLYAPHQMIPQLRQTKLLYTKSDFLDHNPQITLNKLHTQKLLSDAKGKKKSFIPTVDVSIAYQKLNDPTGYGDNHSFGIALQVPLNGGNFQEAKAYKVMALENESKNQEYQIQREQEYLQYYQAYQNAKKQLEVLEHSRKDFEKSEATIQQAYLKQYVDFSTYLQVLQQTLQVKNQIIMMQSQKQLALTIINGIGSGKIYE